MASSSSTSSCFQCHDSSSKCFKNGWKLRNGEHAHLCFKCACVYEEGRFCETFHSTDDGWRDCESCGKLVHCGCVVSFNQYFLLDLGGIICIECSKQKFILARSQRYAHGFQTDPTDVPYLAKRVQIEPHYRPPSIDSDIQCIPKTSKAVLNPLFEKLLSASDVKSGRIVIPRRDAENFFPAVSEPRGIRMNILDMESKDWEVRFHYWLQKNCKTYVLEGLRDFMASRILQAGEIVYFCSVTFYREEPGGRMVIGISKTSVVKPPHQVIGPIAFLPKVLNGEAKLGMTKQVADAVEKHIHPAPGPNKCAVCDCIVAMFGARVITNFCLTLDL
ncbi:B3 domain-containing protein-like protein isoform X1 [Tanacetum coccineum]